MSVRFACILAGLAVFGLGGASSGDSQSAPPKPSRPASDQSAERPPAIPGPRTLGGGVSAGSIVERLDLGARASKLMRSGDSVQSGTMQVSRVRTYMAVAGTYLAVGDGVVPGAQLRVYGAGFGGGMQRGVFFMPDSLNPEPDNWAEGRGYWARTNVWTDREIRIEAPTALRAALEDRDSMRGWILVVRTDERVAGIRARIVASLSDLRP